MISMVILVVALEWGGESQFGERGVGESGVGERSGEGHLSPYEEGSRISRRSKGRGRQSPEPQSATYIRRLL